jgi:heat shock protein HtpX
MGISNVRSGAALALGGANPSAAIRVMQWDLVNAWARIYELGSTHPLTALRVQALNIEAAQMHQAPAYPMQTSPRRRWGAFTLEFFLWAAPIVAGAVLAANWIAYGSLRRVGLVISESQSAILLLFLGATWTIRILYRYHGRFAPQTINSLIEDLNVSEMRPRAVRLEGKILGRGIPGAFWSPDLVLQDQTGLLFLLYRQSIPFARLAFALTDAESVIDQQVTIEGWFRRGLQPYVEMSILKTAGGRTFRAYSRWIQLGLAAFAVVAGLMSIHLLPPA